MPTTSNNRRNRRDPAPGFRPARRTAVNRLAHVRLVFQIFGGADHRIHERDEFDMDRAECRTQDAEFSGPQILGARVLCHDRWPGREVIRAYIRNQELADRQLEQLISAAQNPINRPNIP